MGNLKHRDGGTRGPATTSSNVLDCIFDLHTAAICSFLAIESLANHAIETLDDATTVTIKKRVYTKHELVRELRINDKMKRIFPLVDGGRSIAGDAVLWGRYCALKDLRDELVHVKKRGINSDPDDPSAYDRLMLGEGDTCVETACDVVEGAWPGFLPPHVREALGRG